MSSFFIPGPICRSRQPGTLEDGTLTLNWSSVPGPICSTSPLFPSLVITQMNATPVAPRLEFLFQNRLNPARGLSEEDYAIAARTLDVDVASIKAVAEVETAGEAFGQNGRPKILFERHYFHRFTNGNFDNVHPAISNHRAGGYGRFSVQYTKLETAYQLNPNAALRSASWGRFQIMGDNFRAAGYDSVVEFVLAMTRSEAAHL